MGRRGLPPFLPTAGIAVLLLGGTLPSASHGSPPAATTRACSADADPAATDLLRNRLEAGRARGEFTAAGATLRARVALPEFYLRRGWAPAWVDGLDPSPCARALVAGIERAQEDGLDAADYHLAAIRDGLGALTRGPTPALAVDLDLLLTDAFLTLGSHLLRGRVNPITVEAEWLANRRDLDMATALERALASGDVPGALESFHPAQPEYVRLRGRLGELRALARSGGWGTVPSGPTFRPGDDDARVPALRNRLVKGGDLAASEAATGTVFDEALGAAVVRFQERHGLDPDGAVGARTVEALNVPVLDRVRQIEINMERWRWLPDELGRTHVRVNIADYRVEVRDADSVALVIRAVVGRQYRETPMFTGRMTHLVLAPYWHVPPGIAANDKLPELKRNPAYLANQQMTLLDVTTNQPVDPGAVDFAALSGSDFNRRYRIRQDPGPLNALGRVKFMFPNVHDVYLHDTPSREHFALTERAFSSGCIRLERPLELADWLLRDEPGWSPERIRQTAAQPRETTVRLAEPVPVHLLYWTSFVDDEGRVNFRADIYGRDGRVARGLAEEPPGL